MTIFKFRLNNIILMAVLIVFSACQQQTAQKNEAPIVANIEEDKAAVKDALVQMWDAIEKEDIDRYASYVHPEFTQFGEYDAELREGKEAEVKGVAGWIAESDSIHTEMVDPKVTINGNVAWITYYWSDHGTTNGVPFASTGKSTRIFVKENGTWLCIHGHYTLPPGMN